MHLARAPRVAVIILQWGRGEETAACLRSLTALDYESYTILVVDNHSPDGSVAHLRTEFPQLSILENPTNLGFAGGCNAGIRAALADPTIEYILLLNNDTRVSPELLRHMVEAAESDPAAVVVGALNFSGDRHTSSGGRLDRWTGRYVDLLDEYPLATVSQQPVVEVEAVAGSSMLMRAGSLRAGELLDPAFFCMFEETDWCLRQRARGGRVLLSTRARLEHHVAATMGKPLNFYFRFRNRPYFMARHARLIHWLTFLPYYLTEAGVRILAYALVGRRAAARGILLGVWDAALGKLGPGRLEQFLH